jgi:hypothetical protein
VVVILVGGLKCRTQFWKGTTQESFQQSLVEIGSVVSEEKIFLNFNPPFSNLHNRSKLAKVQISLKKSRNTYYKAHHYAYTVQIWAHYGLK